MRETAGIVSPLMTDLAFATFNTQLGLRSRLHRWAEYDVGAACRSLEADVIALQEVWIPHGSPSVVDELAAGGFSTATLALGTVRRIAGHRPHTAPGKPGTVGLAVASRFPIRSQRALPIGRVWRDPLGARSALHVELEVDGTLVDVVTVHASSRLPYGPVIHLRNLRRQLPTTDRPAIVAGDCNIWGPVVARVLPEWRRAALGKTWPSQAPHSQIDHILVNRHVATLGGGAVAHDGSDHRPMRATLRLATA